MWFNLLGVRKNDKNIFFSKLKVLMQLLKLLAKNIYKNIGKHGFYLNTNGNYIFEFLINLNVYKLNFWKFINIF